MALQRPQVDENKVDAQTGGYELEMFEDKAKAKQYICPLCQLIMKEPTDIGCGSHSCCKTCVDNMYNQIERTKHMRGYEDRDHDDPGWDYVPSRVAKKCPICDKTLNKDDVEQDDDRLFETLSLKVKCLKCNDWNGKLGNLKKHLKKECGKTSILDKFGFMKISDNSPKFQIFVRKLEGGDIVFNDVSGKDKVSYLKLRIQDKEGIPMDKQRLVYLGRNVDVIFDGREALLEDYNVKDQSCLNMVKRLKGGLDD